MPGNAKQSFSPTPVVPEPTRNLQRLLAVSGKKKQLEFLVHVMNAAVKSFCDPGDQLRVAARRLESAIVNPDVVAGAWV